MSDLFNTTFSAAGISVYYGSTCAVDNVSFDLMPGQLNAVIGNNGCGKTSLIKAIMGLIKHNGKCQLNEHLLENLSVKKKAQLISYIPQRNNLTISMTVREVCLLGFNPHMHILGGYTTDMIKRADKAIDMVGLNGLYESDFLALSEGQKQLCILARTIIEASPLLLLDEPDSALDFSNRHLLMQRIRSIVSDGRCVLMCIHSPELALEYCDNIFLMKAGTILTSINTHTDSLDTINEKMSLIYDNINVIECTDINHKTHRIVVAL